MAPKADVEGAVNSVHPLEEDDDPFLVRDTQLYGQGGGLHLCMHPRTIGGTS